VFTPRTSTSNVHSVNEGNIVWKRRLPLPVGKRLPELDDAIGLSAVAGETLADTRTSKNGRHALVGLLRQSVFGRLARLR
jgi:hypothetical protein